MTKQLNITLAPKPLSYPIMVGENLLQNDQLIQLLKSFKASHYAIVSDTNVERYHARKLEDYLKKQGLNVSLIAFPPGENYKSRSTKDDCEDHLLNLGAGRDTCLIGMGGGIVTDLSGYIAATYCRGIPSVMIPTSLLAMVDASIGGKTGINVPQGKNLIGTITQPNAVFIDTTTLKTLPIAEIKNGIAEMIKHGLIADKNYLEFMRKHSKQLLQLDLSLMEEAIYGSIVIKGKIVEQDETEKGMRRLLNFGHTMAHAIEVATNHDIPHGRAVAIGVVVESYLAKEMGHLSAADFATIREIFDLYQIDLTWKGSLKPSQLLELMRMDKKSLSQTPRFVILEGIGKPLPFNEQYCTSVDEKLLDKAIAWMCSEVMAKPLIRLS